MSTHHGGLVVSSVASQEEGSWFESRLGAFYVEFSCFPYACMGFLLVTISASSHKPKNIHIKLISDSKLCVGVSVSVHVCLYRAL